MPEVAAGDALHGEAQVSRSRAATFIETRRPIEDYRSEEALCERISGKRVTLEGQNLSRVKSDSEASEHTQSIAGPRRNLKWACHRDR